MMNGNLEDMIQKQPLTEEECRLYFRDLISAVEYCHECAKIVHRDIKPENILIDDNNRIKLADFGVSFIMENGKDDIKTAAGSSCFQSPEACQGVNIKGKNIDIWACGVTLYRMMTRQYPFNGANVTDLYIKIINEQPVYPSFLNPLLVDLLKKMLIKDPNNRITTLEIKVHPWITLNGQDPMEFLEQDEIKQKEIQLSRKDVKSAFSRLKFIARVMVSTRKS